MKVWDCCTFNDEVDHLQARIELLDGVVEGHFVVEGTHTHQGAIKTIGLGNLGKGDTDRLAWGYADLEPYSEPWDREHAQRDFLGPWLRAVCDPDDLVLICDIDEHVNPEIIPHAIGATEQGPVSLGMRMFYYGLDWEDVPVPGLPGWVHPRALRVRDIPDSLSTLRETPQDRVLYGAGWHVSYAGGEERRLAKLTQFAHAEQDNEHTRQRVREGPLTGIGPNGEVLEPVPSLDGVPDALVRRFK